MEYAIALTCDLDRRLTTVSAMGIKFNVGLGYLKFFSIGQAQEFISIWKPRTTWNWNSYEIVEVDEKNKSHKIKKGD